MLDDTDVMLELGKSINTTISKTTSRLFQYVFPKTTDAEEMVLLKIKNTSQSSQCSLVSVQPIGSHQVKNISQLTNTSNEFLIFFKALRRGRKYEIWKRNHVPNNVNFISNNFKERTISKWGKYYFALC